MNIKIKIGLFVFIVIGVVILNITYKNKTIKTNRKSNLAIMIKEDSGEYVSSNEIPKGNYALNEEKTVCENGGKVVSYNNLTGQIGFSFLGSDRCSLYFDKIIDTQKPIISNLNVDDTTVTAVLTDDKGLSSYGISSSNTVEPANWTSINGTSYNLSINITTEGTYYLWVKDTSGNVTTKEFMISLGTSFETLMVANNSDIFDENGLRYEGADPNNYICLDSQKSGSCTSSSLLFRIIGLFDEEYSTDGTTSSGTKKLLKVIDTNNYGGTSGKAWNSAGSNNWSTASLKTELNGTYLTTLLGMSNVNSKLSSGIVNAKWHLGGVSPSESTALFYTHERSTDTIYSGNPESIYATIGLMYPSDLGYATVGGETKNKTSCRSTGLNNFVTTAYIDCKNNDWLYTSQVTSWGSNKNEWCLSHISFSPTAVYSLYSSSSVYIVDKNLLAVRPTFYLDTSILKIVGGTGTLTNPYHIG